jgi:hypothetical protein
MVQNRQTPEGRNSCLLRYLCLRRPFCKMVGGVFVLYLYQLVQVFSAILQEANSFVCLSQLHLCRYLCGLAVDPCGMVASLCTTTVISVSSVTSPAARYVHRLTFQWRLVNTARRMAFSFTTNGVLCVDCL